MFLLCGSVAIAGEKPRPVVLSIDAVTRIADVARYRLTKHLTKQGCLADIRFNRGLQAAALVFRFSAKGSPDAMVLSAKNSEGSWPQPVWVTRRTSGVRSIEELDTRDLAIVAGEDPMASALPLGALATAGIWPKSGRIYEAGNFSSALGLLLHNNTHAAVSEAGFAGQFLESQDLVITWLGDPVMTVGWYRGNNWSEQALACEEALGHLNRADDEQAFAVFPEWVHGFARTDSQ